MAPVADLHIIEEPTIVPGGGLCIPTALLILVFIEFEQQSGGENMDASVFVSC